MRVVRRLLASRTGATAVEFGLVLPIVLAFILGSMECARMVRLQTALNYAAQYASRCAAIRPDLCGTPAKIESVLLDRTSQLKAGEATVTVTPDQPCGALIEVESTRKFLLWAIFTREPTLKARACRGGRT